MLWRRHFPRRSVSTLPRASACARIDKRLPHSPRRKFPSSGFTAPSRYVLHTVSLVLPLFGTLSYRGGFSHRVYHRGSNGGHWDLVFSLSSFMAFGLACLLLLLRSAERGEVLQYLTRSASSCVESRRIRVFRLFTFQSFSPRQYDTSRPLRFHPLF